MPYVMALFMRDPKIYTVIICPFLKSLVNTKISAILSDSDFTDSIAMSSYLNIKKVTDFITPIQPVILDYNTSSFSRVRSVLSHFLGKNRGVSNSSYTADSFVDAIIHNYPVEEGDFVFYFLQGHGDLLIQDTNSNIYNVVPNDRVEPLPAFCKTYYANGNRKDEEFTGNKVESDFGFYSVDIDDDEFSTAEDSPENHSKKFPYKTGQTTFYHNVYGFTEESPEKIILKGLKKIDLKYMIHRTLATGETQTHHVYSELEIIRIDENGEHPCHRYFCLDLTLHKYYHTLPPEKYTFAHASMLVNVRGNEFFPSTELASLLLGSTTNSFFVIDTCYAGNFADISVPTDANYCIWTATGNNDVSFDELGKGAIMLHALAHNFISKSSPSYREVRKNIAEEISCWHTKYIASRADSKLLQICQTPRFKSNSFREFDALLSRHPYFPHDGHIDP